MFRSPVTKSRINLFVLFAVILTFVLTGSGCTGGQKSIETLRYEGDWAMSRNEYQSAVDSYSQILERTPGDPEASLNLGKSYLALGDGLKAQRYLDIAYEQAGIRSSQTFEIGTLKADAMGMSGDVSGMVSFLKNAAETTGEARAWIRLGDLSAKYGDPDTAELAYRTAIRMEPTPAVEPYLKLAIFYESLGKTEDATKRLRQAYTIDPTNKDVIRHLKTYYPVVGPSLDLPPDQ